MPVIMPHSCGNASRFHEARRSNAAFAIRLLMHERQKIIAEWMQEVIARRDISARAWAELAGLGKDTVSRAIRADYKHVTKTTTVAALADAIGEQAPGLAAAIPSAASLAAVLETLHEAILGKGQVGPDTTRALAEALRDTLLHLADEQVEQDDEKMTRALARASVRQLQHRPA